MATYTDIKDLIDANLASGTKIPATKHREVEMALLDYIEANLAQMGDIKVIKADATYISNNFERDGLGKNLRAGWAMCNGNNDTDNLQGRVPIHYSRDFTLGTYGGSKDAVVVAHSHGLPIESGGNLNIQSIVSNGNNDESYSETNRTTTVGVPGKNKNMQPYFATVYIMKL